MNFRKTKGFLLLALGALTLSACSFDFSIKSHSWSLPGLSTSEASTELPIYPESITLPSSMRVGVNAKKVLRPTLAPANASVREFTYSTSNPAVATVSSAGVVEGIALGTCEIKVSARGQTGNVVATTSLEVVESTNEDKVEMQYNYKDIAANNFYGVDSAPTLGKTKLLIIPVWFTDSSTYIKTANRENVRADIQKAYLGTAEDTGWHSVKSFYEAESKGLLTLEGTVTSWYECGKRVSEYSASGSQGKVADLVSAATKWYFSSNPSDSRTNYDADGDGYLDGVMLIYAAPDYEAMDDKNKSNLWAYCYWIQDDSRQSVLAPGANTFFWASYDFMYSPSQSAKRTGVTRLLGGGYGSGDTSHCSIDAHTYIHEMGHVFGLDDYYDYGPNSYNLAGGFSMQDYNIGGHDPFSAMAFGWVGPYIPTTSCSLTISPFQKNHDLILLTPSWNEFDSPFDEYLLLELYTPTGLNAFDSAYTYANKYPKGPSIPGIRLWHVDSRLAYVNRTIKDRDGYDIPEKKLSQLTSNPAYDCTYGIVQAFANSVGDEDYSGLNDNYNLLKLIRNDKSAPLHAKTKNDLKAADLFVDGSSFSMADYQSQFANRTKLNGGSALGWNFTVSIAVEGDEALATIDLVKA